MSTVALLEAMRGALAVLESAPGADLSTLSDADLRALVTVETSLRRVVERHAAVTTGEISRRSRPELGLGGFAQRAGHRTVEEFLKVETGVSGRDAATTVRVGVLATSGGVLGDAVRDGRVSVAAADAIRAGLGDPADGVPVEVLEQASDRLCDEADALDPDRLQRRAREVRDELDEAGIVDRERVRRAARSLRLVRQPDGMTRIVWLLDPESAAIVTTVYDRATSPRRGGPRFVDPAAREKAARVADDDRTTEQLASDAFTELLRQSAAIDREVLIGGDEPAVRVLVPASSLASGDGHGTLESGETVALTTVHRLACAAGTLPIVLDSTGQALDLGREQRFYNRRQRRALAARDGGCMWPGCDRPPSWTEAHHTRRWSDGGRTDLADGILLCRHHHLRLHDEGWSISRRAGRYWLEPPPGSGRTGALLETKSRAVRELLAAG
jgi:hypothetical protein